MASVTTGRSSAIGAERPTKSRGAVAFCEARIGRVGVAGVAELLPGRGDEGERGGRPGLTLLGVVPCQARRVQVQRAQTLQEVGRPDPGIRVTKAFVTAPSRRRFTKSSAALASTSSHSVPASPGPSFTNAPEWT